MAKIGGSKSRLQRGSAWRLAAAAKMQAAAAGWRHGGHQRARPALAKGWRKWRKAAAKIGIGGVMACGGGGVGAASALKIIVEELSAAIKLA